jgi:serine/threonine-protein kinase
MENRPTRPKSRKPVVFRDGLGRRARTLDAAGVELEVLCLRPELSTAGAEAALRERVHRLANFRSGAFAKVRTVQRLNDAASTLALVSVATPGLRLSDLMQTSARLDVPLDGSAAWALMLQLTSAMAHLHEHAPDVAHGALAPERIVITPDARVMVVEHVLSSVLETLKWTQEQYWREQRIAAASTGRPLDMRGDVRQIGIVALSLAHGRVLEDGEYPEALPDLVESAAITSVTGGREPMSANLRLWLDRTLQLDDRRSFSSAIEASAELHQLMAESDSVVVPLALESFLARLQKATDRDRADSAPPNVVEAPAAAARPATVDPLPPAIGEVQAQSDVAGAEPPMPAPTVADEPPADVTRPREPGSIANPALQSVLMVTPADHDAAPFDAQHATPDRQTNQWRERPWSRQAAAAAILTVVCGVGWVAASRLFADDKAPAIVAPRDMVAAPSTPAPPPAAPEVVADPAPAALPAAAAKPPITSTPAPAAVEAPAAPAAGWVTIRSPQPLNVLENGVLVGTTRGGRLPLPPGSHQLELVSDELGYRTTETVVIRSGAESTLAVTLPDGSLSLNATPWAEVFVDGRSVGETPIGNLPVSAGSHEVVFRHPELGEQRMTAVVTVNAPTRLTADLRKQP